MPEIGSTDFSFPQQHLSIVKNSPKDFVILVQHHAHAHCSNSFANVSIDREKFVGTNR